MQKDVRRTVQYIAQTKNGIYAWNTAAAFKEANELKADFDLLGKLLLCKVMFKTKPTQLLAKADTVKIQGYPSLSLLTYDQKIRVKSMKSFKYQKKARNN